MNKLEHGVAVRLNSRVRRLVAPNPGPMTGAGTNTYLLGDNEVAVLDPGPALPEHVDAILSAGGGRIRWIVCTHTHMDHSPAWEGVAASTGAELIGATAADSKFQDPSFHPPRQLQHDELLKTAEFTLRAIHTPGHVSNHFCFLLEEDGLLFAGDHIMNGSTVVIVPPGGNMKAYIESLQLLRSYPVKAIAPGHGEIIDDPEATIKWLVNHRLQREAKVLAELQSKGRCRVEDLVPSVYDDVDVSLHEMAKLSLTAHLIKLAAEGRASHSVEQELWEPLNTAPS